MKSTGIVRKVDDLGRITLPIELRPSLGLDEKDPVEIFIDGDKIVIKKYKPNMECAATGEISEDNLVLLGGKLILSIEGAKQLINEIDLK